jgi:hypothetical protein
VEFIRQDDLEGPYQVVPEHLVDDYRPWEYLIIPLPPKVYMSGERAEVLGRAKLLDALDHSDLDPNQNLARAVRDHTSDYRFRTTALLSSEFKDKVSGRPEPIASAYQWMQMSRWVWIVELVLGPEWDRDEPSVLAEAVLDATGHAEDSEALSWRIPGLLSMMKPDFPQYYRRPLTVVGPQPSVVQLCTSAIDAS